MSKKILYIDDGDLDRLYVSRILNKKKDLYSLDTAHNAETGIAKFSEESYDLVILDMFLGYPDGLEVLQELKKMEHSCKFMAVSSGGNDISFGSKQILKYAEKFGAHMTLEKPFTNEAFLSCLEELLPQEICKYDSPQFISSEEVQALLPMKEAIALMREAYVFLSEGKAEVPIRMNVPLQKVEGCSLIMPAYIPHLDLYGIKTVNVFPKNPELNRLPMIHGAYLLFEGRTGRLKGMMDAQYLTALRTGAGSGLATDLLASKKSSVLAMFGTGAQSKSQIRAVCAVRPIQTVYVFCRDKEKGQHFCDSLSKEIKASIILAKTEEQLKEADVICTATNSFGPVFQHKNLKPGVHINGVGSYQPEMTEIPAETVCAAKIVVDQREASLHEAGDLIQPLKKGLIEEKDFSTEIGELVAGTKTLRESDQDITFFKSVGNAVQDLICANAIVLK